MLIESIFFLIKYEPVAMIVVMLVTLLLSSFTIMFLMETFEIKNKLVFLLSVIGIFIFAQISMWDIRYQESIKHTMKTINGKDDLAPIKEMIEMVEATKKNSNFKKYNLYSVKEKQEITDFLNKINEDKVIKFHEYFELRHMFDEFQEKAKARLKEEKQKQEENKLSNLLKKEKQNSKSSKKNH